MQAQSLSGQHAFADYLNLTKPRIGMLAVFTTFVGMWLAAQGLPPIQLLIFTLLGTALAAGAAGALNNFLDRDIDTRMERTAQRPLPSGRLLPYQALSLGISLSLASFAMLVIFVNLLTALLALFAIFFYAPVYTLWLKRKTPLCTVLGGITGAIPPLMGWTAVTHGIEPAALVLFAILFLWQPPHFWALALLSQEEYRNAGIPMLPVVHGSEMTRRQIVLYAAALLPISVLLYPTGVVGFGYVIPALILGAGFLWMALRCMLQPGNPRAAQQLFLYSLLYLAGLSLAMILDPITSL
jgi:protoheme IX farnesyltransferase